MEARIVIKKCKICEKLFHIENPNKNAVRYCSDECRKEGMKQINKKYWEKNKDKINQQRKRFYKEKRNCRFCKKEFEAFHPNAKFCSIKCKNKFAYLLNKEKNDIKRKAINNAYRARAKDLYKKWTKDDIKKLKRYYKKGYTNQKIAEKLGRTPFSVAVKISRLAKDDYFFRTPRKTIDSNWLDYKVKDILKQAKGL